MVRRSGVEAAAPPSESLYFTAGAFRGTDAGAAATVGRSFYSFTLF